MRIIINGLLLLLFAVSTIALISIVFGLFYGG